MRIPLQSIFVAFVAIHVPSKRSSEPGPHKAEMADPRNKTIDSRTSSLPSQGPRSLNRTVTHEYVNSRLGSSCACSRSIHLLRDQRRMLTCRLRP